MRCYDCTRSISSLFKRMRFGSVCGFVSFVAERRCAWYTWSRVRQMSTQSIFTAYTQHIKHSVKAEFINAHAHCALTYTHTTLTHGKPCTQLRRKRHKTNEEKTQRTHAASMREKKIAGKLERERERERESGEHECGQTKTKTKMVYEFAPPICCLFCAAHT